MSIRLRVVRALMFPRILAIMALPIAARAQAAPIGYTPEQCASCAAWNRPHAPVRLFGNTYWVGTDGLGAILVTSDSGHVLIDGGLPESAPLILRSIRALGFRVTDIRIIVNSHTHYDHAGGISALQRASGAAVLAMPRAAPVLARAMPDVEDPQRDTLLPYPAVSDVRTIADGDTVRVGPLVLVGHLTPGHAPGGTTWSWRSCDGGRCLDLVYADSQTPVSVGDFRFSDGDRVPRFERGLATIEGLACDILVTPHPGASSLWERVSARDAGSPDALIDPAACRRYAQNGRNQLARRIARERAGR